MSTDTVEATTTTEAPAAATKPEVTYVPLAPTRKRVDMATQYEGVIYVTSNEAGRLRAATPVDADAKLLKVGDTFLARNPKTKHVYGELTIVGRVTAKGSKTGDVPAEGKLPLRLLG